MSDRNLEVDNILNVNVPLNGKFADITLADWDKTRIMQFDPNATDLSNDIISVLYDMKCAMDPNVEQSVVNDFVNTLLHFLGFGTFPYQVKSKHKSVPSTPDFIITYNGHDVLTIRANIKNTWVPSRTVKVTGSTFTFYYPKINIKDTVTLNFADPHDRVMILKILQHLYIDAKNMTLD